MIIAVIILSLALILCAALVVMLKRDIKRLNQTLRTIEKTDTNMRATTETFDKDISGLCVTINDILEKQKKVMAASVKDNREFRQAVTNISHDLRTPLTSAIGYIQMIKSEKTPDEKKFEYFDVIEQRLKSLSNLMNGLFEYTQIVEGKVTQNIEKINICNVLRDISSDYYGDFIGKNFTVEIDIPDSPVYILCDAGSFKRMAHNLVLNVITHGAGYFRLSVDNNSIIFQNKVSNPAEIEPERLFERFYTADLSRSGNATGLGLAIVKEIARSIGGEVSASLENDMLTIYVYFSRFVRHDNHDN
jgi:signal transduction histidine kinase